MQDINSNILSIELSNWGEIFLNPELKEIIKYAYSKKIGLFADNGVNFNNVSDEVLECLIFWLLFVFFAYFVV